jgi:putative ABC transport system permease protein
MPDWRRDLDARLAALGVPPTRRADIATEVAQHLADQERTTLDPGEAERLVRELALVERRVPADPPILGTPKGISMHSIWQDLRYAVRSLRLTPAYTAVVVATLALGIGANSAIFSVADAVMLRPYPYPGIERIVALNERVRAGQQMSVAWPTFQDWLVQNRSFESLGVYRNAPANLTGGDQPERLSAAVVSSGVFGAMGIAPLMGRTFGPEEDVPNAARAAIVSERLWRTRFGADPGLVGRSLVLNGEPHLVVGIMPSAMRFPSRLTDVWLPIGPVVPTFPASRGSHPGLFAIGRLKADVTFDAAVSDMDAVARRIEADNPSTNHNVAVAMVPYYEQIVGSIRPTLFILLGAVGFVLLIGCANLANLMLARSERRQREIALRAALGAARRRVIQQLLTESLLLAVLGGGLGLLLATWSVRLFVASRPVSVPRIDLVGVDARVIFFAGVLSIATGIAFGLVPALRASAPDLVSSLNESGRSTPGVRSARLRSSLVVAEVALALVLLVGAGLMIRSFMKLMAIHTGFNPDGVVTMRLTLPPAKYQELDRWQAFHRDLTAAVSSIPGVQSAGLNSAVPLEGGGSEAGVAVEGRPMPSMEHPGPATLFQASSPGYLQTMGIRLVRGRYFTAQDSKAAAPVVIVDESLVRQLFANEEPLGKRISFEFHGAPGAAAGVVWREIVGIVSHVHHYGLASEPPFVQLYVPLEQLPIYFMQRRPSMALVAKTTMAPEVLTAAIRREIAALDPDIPVYNVQTMRNYIAQDTEQPRLGVILLTGLGGLALVLAVIGIYGVVSSSVTERVQEIGVRMALGASRRDVLWMVVGRSAALVLAGVVLGTAASLALASLLQRMVFEISPRDPATLAAIAAGLTTVGILAALVPARRATRVDPIVAMRAH